MNWRSTAALLVIALVLLAVVYFGVIQPEQSATPTPFPTPVPPVLLFNVPPERVNTLRVQRPAEGQAVTLQRGADGVWRIIEAATPASQATATLTATVKATGTATLTSTPAPTATPLTLPAPADLARVSAAVQQLATLGASRALTENVDLQLFGLVAPSTVITFTATSGITGTEHHVLNIGVPALTGGAFYAQKDNEPTVYLVSSTVINALTSLLDALPVQPTPVPTATITPTPTPTSGAPAGTPGTPAPPGTLTPTPVATSP